VKVPDLTKVESSRFQSMGHSSHGLFVRFNGGALYQYHDVPEVVFDRGVKAESKGKWFQTEIKGHYKHSLVDE